MRAKAEQTLRTLQNQARKLDTRVFAIKRLNHISFATLKHNSVASSTVLVCYCPEPQV